MEKNSKLNNNKKYILLYYLFNNKGLIKPCNICENDATCLCFDCLNYFCESCYKLIHDKKKKEHKKEKADPFVPIEIKCPEHPNGIMDFFCVKEKGKLLYIINFF